jgi:hypothetical protein
LGIGEQKNKAQTTSRTSQTKKQEQIRGNIKMAQQLAPSNALTTSSLTLSMVAILFIIGSSLTQAATPFTIPGQFAVSPNGSATYSTPIQVPPGTAGMAPALSLNYDSQAGNGTLGMGWGLSGFSQITRCPQTLAQDGVRGSINFDANDKYCIDGQRLIATVGTYGVDGTEYRTELANFAKVISYGAAGSGPAWFKVWTKGGQVIEYGNTADSRIEAQGKASARLWGVNKISDTKGNYLTVSYTEDSTNGEAYVSRVDYTGNANSTPALAPYASVQFTYETRPDTEAGYQAGSVIKVTRRMTNIKTYYGITLIKDYRLTYGQGTATQRSQLKALTECDVAGACLNPTSLNWFQATTGSYNIVGYVSTVDACLLSCGPWQAGDVNGDGKTDLIHITSNPGQVITWIAKGDGSYNIVGYVSTVDACLLSCGQWQAGDVNGDGKTDLIHIANNSGQMITWMTPVINSSEDSISSVTPGLGATTSITYKPLTDTSVYTKDSSSSAATYPIQDVQAPMYVVSTASSSDGLGGTVSTNYSYGGAKIDLDGRGFLGFRWLKSSSPDAGLNVTTFNRQDYPYIGLPSQIEKRKISDNTLLSAASSSYTNQALGGTRYFPYIDIAQEYNYELDGSLVSHVTSSYQYDAYGNATQVVVNSNDGNVKTTTNTYQNDTTNWYLGRLLRSSVTSTSP